MGFSIIITLGLFILLFIAGSGITYRWEYMDIDDVGEGILLGLLGIATGLLISLLVCGLIIPGIAMAFEADTVITGEEATKLYALKDNSGVSGSFFLGCGSVETDNYIYYITYEEGKGYEVEKQGSNYNVYIDYLTNEQVKATIIAYEPIWAIGTGKTATSEDANNSIIEIRKEIEKIYGKDVADCVIIQYGGSVKSSNAKELFNMSDIDGGLVGGASLKPDEFAKIVNYNVE
jgi:hypothetical protein